jgi:uncharacterized SAM-binding protein YcdF (DUF218 family)
MEFKEVKLTAITNNDSIKKSNAVILLEGDGHSRINQTIKIFKRGLAENIVVSGGITTNPPFTTPASILAEEIYKEDIPKDKVIIEEKSLNTYEQGIEIMKLAKANGWKSIILVASHFHQPRAFLTFLKAMNDSEIKIQIFNSPARELSWFEKTSMGLSRLELLEDEFKKIDEYGKKGHLATIDEAIAYQQWKEEQK